MPERATLVVVVVGDVGLRCMLAASLSLLDIELLTASHYRQLQGHRLRGSAILVMDEADLARKGDVTIDKLRRDRRWQMLAVLAAEGPPSANRDWPIYVSRAAAESKLAQLSKNGQNTNARKG